MATPFGHFRISYPKFFSVERNVLECDMMGGVSGEQNRLLITLVGIIFLGRVTIRLVLILETATLKIDVKQDSFKAKIFFCLPF